MKYNFKVFSIEPENNQLIPVEVGSHTEYQDAYIKGEILIRYSVINHDRLVGDLLEKSNKNYIPMYLFAPLFKAGIYSGDVKIEADIVEVCSIAFGGGDYQVRYTWLEERADD